MEGLKDKVEQWCRRLASQEVTQDEILDGSKQFYELILGVWSMDTSFAVDAAELVCNTLRYDGSEGQQGEVSPGMTSTV